MALFFVAIFCKVANFVVIVALCVSCGTTWVPPTCSTSVSTCLATCVAARTSVVSTSASGLLVQCINIHWLSVVLRNSVPVQLVSLFKFVKITNKFVNKIISFSNKDYTAECLQMCNFEHFLVNFKLQISNELPEFGLISNQTNKLTCKISKVVDIRIYIF